uniref:PPC domain-containing protein n=1 Tax=Ananas comosus var. bracteatus TaxID=296719 RepID=A0A6V7P845_ANACO|nr:unnamed protein product [Ananas comosus var. bracteatus]
MFSRSFPTRFHRQERESLSDDVSKGGDEEVEGGGGGGGSGSGGGEAAAAAAGKRPRGRPPGSKNKPKTPAADAAEQSPAPAMRPHVLEIRPGHDVADALARFVRGRGVGICVLSAHGAVSDVTLRSGGGPPAAAAAEGGAAVRLLGRLEVLSMSGALLPPASASASAAAGLTVSLSGPQGQVLGARWRARWWRRRRWWWWPRRSPTPPSTASPPPTTTTPPPPRRRRIATTSAAAPPRRARRRLRRRR